MFLEVNSMLLLSCYGSIYFNYSVAGVYGIECRWCWYLFGCYIYGSTFWLKTCLVWQVLVSDIIYVIMCILGFNFEGVKIDLEVVELTLFGWLKGEFDFACIIDSFWN